MDAEKTCRVVNAEGATMIELKGIRVEGNRIVVTGALMGAWDTDMYIDAESLKAAACLIPLPSLGRYLVDNLLDIEVTRQL